MDDDVRKILAQLIDIETVCACDDDFGINL
jgi:hypothetical protein